MAVDYKAIADRAQAILGAVDPARYQEAYVAMSAETTTRAKPGGVRMNRRILMATLGVATSAALLAKVAAGIDGSPLDSATKTYLKAEIDGEGIDLSHPETQAMLQSFVDAGVLTAAEHDQLTSLTQEEVSAWPGLLPGHVQNALEKRAAGEV